jgi:hypothetical protein
MVVTRVDPLSFAKITGILYALLGVCFGALFSLMGLAGVFQRTGAPGAGLLFGAGAIVILPIFYGGLGFVFSLIGAALYNLVAGWVGGIELDIQ